MIAKDKKDEMAEFLRLEAALTEEKISALRADNLLRKGSFFRSDARRIAKILELPPAEVTKLKDLYLERERDRQRAEIRAKILEIEHSNERLLADSERIAAENNSLFERTKQLQERHKKFLGEYHEVEAVYKELKNTIAVSQVEYNRISLEISFLRDERQRLLDLIGDRNETLGELLQGFEKVKNSYEFARGEADDSEEMLSYLESQLTSAIKHKGVLEEHVGSTQENFEKLYFELSEVIKKGKMSYYKNLND